MSKEQIYRILLVDDEPDILEFLSYTLRKEGFEVKTASDGASGVSVVSSFKPDLILLDVMMPGMDGIEACSRIRSLPNQSGIIICFLTARSEDYSQIAGFEAGGDDYIIKPVKPRVLVSRVNALLRRAGNSQSTESFDDNQIKVGNFVLDRDRFVVVKDGVDISLPRKEFELVNLLISRPGRVFSRDDIFRVVWGDNIIVGERTIDVHIRKIREKIGNDTIQTIKGVGYKFNDL
jgi:two-component system alkaline phosphatase synthesis response regulator PhoP